MSFDDTGGAGAVIYVKDIARVRVFYEAVAGFRVEHEAPGHIVLRAASSELILVRMPDAIAATIEISTPPAKRADNPIKLILPVNDLESARATASKVGGELLPPDCEWEFDGTLVCDGHDPEGNIVQFRQVR